MSSKVTFSDKSQLWDTHPTRSSDQTIHQDDSRHKTTDVARKSILKAHMAVVEKDGSQSPLDHKGPIRHDKPQLDLEKTIRHDRSYIYAQNLDPNRDSLAKRLLEEGIIRERTPYVTR